MTTFNRGDCHPHLLLRMEQRGVTFEEIQITLEKGWKAADAKEGTIGKVSVFPYNAVWEGESYREKEVTVYYKEMHGKVVVLTVITRYGEDFVKEGTL